MTAAPDSNGSLRRLRKRAQFLNAAKGRRAGRNAFSLQAIAVDTSTARRKQRPNNARAAR